jgi:dUTPase-like protein
MNDENATPARADLLRDIFARQASLAEFYRSVRPDGFYSWQPRDRCATWTRAIAHECCELDNELGWKPWKNGPDLAANRDARLDETADILHFFVQLALDQGFSADELYDAYVRKNAENRRRQQEDPRYRPTDASSGSGA